MPRVLVLPGREFGPAVPQLFFPAWAGVRRGARVTWCEWTDVGTVDGLEGRAVEDWVEAQLDGVVAESADEPTLLIGKSLGSFAAAFAARHGMPAIWVTPLLTSAVVREGLRRASAPCLLVGGTADPFWDGAVARDLTPHVLEIGGADHGLFAEGPLASSAANMGLLATATERFLDEVLSWEID